MECMAIRLSEIAEFYASRVYFRQHPETNKGSFAGFITFHVAHKSTPDHVFRSAVRGCMCRLRLDEMQQDIARRLALVYRIMRARSEHCGLLKA
jgi:hypothetical protein